MGPTCFATRVGMVAMRLVDDEVSNAPDNKDVFFVMGMSLKRESTEVL